MIRMLPKLISRQVLPLCVMAVAMSVRLHAADTAAEIDGYLVSAGRVVSTQVKSLLRALFPQCKQGLALDHVAKGRGIRIGDRPGAGGKLAHRGSKPMFSRVDCEGQLSILLDPAGPEGQVRALSTDVHVADSGDVLYLKGSRGRAPYDVVISGKRLVGQISAVHLQDACALSGAGLQQKSWYLQSDTTGDVILKGMFEQCAIMQKKNNILDMYWVSANDVDVVASSGVMRLAGRTQHARFRFSGNSQVLVEGLRADKAWLFASDDAYVELFGARRMSVFTKGHAQVQAEGVPLLTNQLSQDDAVFVVNDGV